MILQLIQSFRHALRQLGRSRAFTITAILTLALGIGANVVVFSVLNAMILRPLDVPQPQRLYNVVHEQHGYHNESYPDYLDFKDKNTSFSDMAAYQINVAGLSTGKTAYKCWYARISGNYFDMLGVTPEFGRLFHASDEHGPNSAPYIVLSDGFWRSHFNADPRIVGATVDILQHPFTIIGVAPAAFHGNDLFLWPEFWIPLVDNPYDQDVNFLSNRWNHNLWILGKLKPNVTLQQASDDLNSVAYQLRKQYPADDNLSARLVKPGLMGDQFGDPARAFLIGVMLLAFLVLLAVCVNLASLFAARATDRSRELAIRLAIGSSRWHVLRQLLSEAVLVSVVGGAMGTVFSVQLLHALSNWRPFPEFPVHVGVSPDWRVYCLAPVLSMGSGILFGLLPARQIWKTDSTQVIKNSSTTSFTLGRFAFRDLLLGVQIMLCTFLVTASLVALRGMQRSLHSPIGFQPQGAILAETDLHMGGHSDESSVQIQQRMLRDAAVIPGVTAVGIINEIPLGTGVSSSLVYRQEATDFRPSNSPFQAKFFSISPGYLSAAGTRLLAGRDFTWHDDENTPKIVIVNETFAHAMFGNTSAVGMRFKSGDGTSFEITGVVEDGKYDSLTESPWPAMFFPMSQQPDSNTTLVLRTSLPQSEIAPQLSRTLANIDPALPFTFQSWPDALDFVLFPARIATTSLGVMGMLAVLIALTGIFGMTMYSVSKRIKELGIRVALGAQALNIMRSALGRSLVLLLAGSVAGLALGIIASSLLAQIVYQATPRDPVVFGGVMITMALLGLIASWIPARRALGVDPAGLLREE
jgi:predicted permease